MSHRYIELILQNMSVIRLISVEELEIKSTLVPLVWITVGTWADVHTSLTSYLLESLCRVPISLFWWVPLTPNFLLLFEMRRVDYVCTRSNVSRCYKKIKVIRTVEINLLRYISF